MSTLGVVIVIGLAIGIAFWFFNRKPETFSESTDKPEVAPYKVPELLRLSEPEATTPIPLVVETAPVSAPVVAEEKVAKAKKASKPKVAAKKTSTVKATAAPKAVKKPKLKTAK